MVLLTVEFLFGGSQYSDETARLIAGQLLEGADEGTTVGVVSAPSVFVALRNLLVRLVLTLACVTEEEGEQGLTQDRTTAIRARDDVQGLCCWSTTCDSRCSPSSISTTSSSRSSSQVRFPRRSVWVQIAGWL